MNASDLARYLFSAQNVLAKLHDENSPLSERFAAEGRLGCYLCVGGFDGVPQLVASVGQPLLEKRDKYLEFSQEKVRRLGLHPNDFSSRASANAEAQQWPGALRGKDTLVALSGYPADVDEIGSGAILVRCGQLSVDEAIKLTAGTEYFEFLGRKFVESLCRV